MNLPFMNVLKQVIQNVQKRNQADPHVPTADKSVFEKVEARLGQNKKVVPEEICDDLCQEMENVKQENAANPNEVTAHGSVFENMKREIEALKSQVAQQKSSAPVSPAPSAARANEAVMAMTNSGGGSLSMRSAPDMGASTLEVRVADNSLVQVLEYSKNSIRLDGKDSRFVKVAVKGHQGWILENYLNFN